MIDHHGRKIKPHHSEPGTLGEQLAAVRISLYLASRRGTTAANEWQDARALVIQHALPTITTSDPPTDPFCSDPGLDAK